MSRTALPGQDKSFPKPAVYFLKEKLSCLEINLPKVPSEEEFKSIFKF